MNTPLQILEKYWGFSSFKSRQEAIIDSVLNGQDTVALLPTGGGKSLCYQFPATFLNKKSVIISPLISLMTDQQMHLEQQGIRCVCLNGETKGKLLQSSGKSLLGSKKKEPTALEKSNCIYCTGDINTA